MECPVCKQPLMVAGSKFESEQGSTDVYQVLTLVCDNPKCNNYAGLDHNNPRVVAGTVKNRVN
jgi:hypothetical protein